MKVNFTVICIQIFVYDRFYTEIYSYLGVVYLFISVILVCLNFNCHTTSTV
jgi:hypothetical protein